MKYIIDPPSLPLFTTIDKIVVNYDAQSLEAARRVTHLLTMYENDIIERQRKGIFRDDIDACSLQHREGEQNDPDSPIDILEQHTWIDLDDDGLKEPYIVTVHVQSKQVLRIVSRFKKINKNKDGEVTWGLCVCVSCALFAYDFQ